MTSMVQHPQQGTSSLAKLTKGGFGFSSHRGHEKKDVVGGDDEDWYIPYNGPYEAPRAPSPRQQRLRDSWGDPLDDYASNTETDDEDIIRRLADLDARNGVGMGAGMGHRRGGTHGSTGSALSGGTETTFTRYVNDEQDRTIRGRSMQRGRAGSGSVFSNQTATTSGAQDPSRTQRQSTISAATGAPKPSHLSLSAVGGGFALGGGGGVGESPVPTRRFGGGDGNRISFASIFSGFSGIGGLANSSGKSHKRGDSNSSIGKLRWGSGSPARSNTAPPESPYAKKMTTTAAAAAPAPQDSPRRIGTPTAWPSGSGSSRPTASPETDRFVRRETETINSRTVNDAVQERIDSLATDDEDYYNSYYSTLIQGSPVVKGKAPMSRGAAPQTHTHIVKKQTSLPLPQSTTRPGQMLHRRTPSNSGESTTSNSRMHLHPHPRGYPNPNLNQVQPQQQQQPGDRLAFPSLSHPNPHSNPHPHPHSHSHSPSLSRQNSASNTSRSTPSRQNSTSSNSYGNATNSNSNSRPHPYAATYVFPSSSVIPPATTSYVQQAYVPRTTTTSGMMNSYTYNANAPNATLSSPTGPVHPNSADAAHLAFSPRDPRTKASEQQRNAGGLGFGMGLLRSLKNSISTPDLRSSLVGNPAGGSTTNLHSGAPQTATTATAAEKGKGTSHNQQQPTFVFPKGKERWLSAQTWCDAVLFPRPRLKIKQDLLANGNGGEALSPTTLMASRNMSPPGTPMTPASAFDDDDEDEEAGAGAGKPKTRPRLTSVRESAIASRVLAYSRSLVDLNSKQAGKEKASAKETGKGKASGTQTRPRAQTQVQSPPIVAGTQGARPRYPSHGVPPAQLRNKERQIPQVTVRPPEAEAGPSSSAAEGQGARPPRPKSWAWDDLALPSPVPSLARVLQEGEQLEAQRQEWQRQAKASFGNKHSRSLSRNRTQSASRARLRHPVQAGHHHHQSSLEYLAAQACLGTQNLTPPIAPRAFHFNSTSSHDSSSNGHSHSSSLVKTISKSSQTHSRNASWSKGALKLAKSTVACGLPLGHGSLSPSSASSSVGHAHPPGDLEGALKTQNTRVIRLADPAQLPVEERPTSLVVRHTPSPAFSALSDSKVGIAIGTPPAEASFDFSLPSHPYAAGGFSISNHTGGNGASGPMDYAGPHPITNTAKPPGISGQRLPPQIAVHPYAQVSSNRDSYIDANGLIGQYRSDANTPHPSKMWAQISPGVVREILPGDIEYSPFMSEDGDRGSPVVSNRNTLMINDTVGVGETLVNAVARLRESKDSGLGTSEGHNGGMPKPTVVNSRAPQMHDAERDVLTSFPSMGWRAPNQGPIINLYAPDHSSESLDDSPYPRRSLLAAASREQSHSPAITSESSSPHTSPQPLGSPHDLDGFQDLFYRPSALPPERTSTEAALPDTPHAWDSINVRHHSRTGSGLTSLARQLTDEFEQIAQEFRDSSVQYTPRSGPVSSTGTTMGSSRGPSIGRRPTNGSFPFVFEEPAEEASVPHAHPTRDGPLQAFKASDTLPEDVLSSRASSFMEPESDDENTGRYRVGMVESVSTPPITSSERRLSFNVQTSLVQGDTGEPTLLSPSHPPLRSPTDSRNSRNRRQILSSLQAPTSTTGATRSSYMTTASDLSRMSGLSDFPVPPKDQNTLSSNISLLSTYFNNDTAMMSNDPHPSGPPGSSAASLMQEERVTFGRHQNADDLAKTLSSPPRFDPPVPF